MDIKLSASIAWKRVMAPARIAQLPVANARFEIQYTVGMRVKHPTVVAAWNGRLVSYHMEHGCHYTITNPLPICFSVSIKTLLQHICCDILGSPLPVGGKIYACHHTLRVMSMYTAVEAGVLLRLLLVHWNDSALLWASVFVFKCFQIVSRIDFGIFFPARDQCLLHFSLMLFALSAQFFCLIIVYPEKQFHFGFHPTEGIGQESTRYFG